MKVSASLPTGVAALFFDSAQRRRHLERLLVRRLESNGFGEVILPVVDYLDPYEEMPSELRRDELYRFVDRDGEVLALRSDFTTMLSRLVAPRLTALDLPLQFFYRGDVLRYQLDRSGSEREFYQIGAEVLGVDGEEGEEKAVEQFLDLLGLGERRPILLVLGFAGALDRLLRDAENPAALLASVVRRQRHGLRQAPVACLEIVERGVPDDAAVLGDDAAARLQRLWELVERLRRRFAGVELRVDLAEFADQVVDGELRKKLARRPYYDGLVFRAFAGRAAEPVGAGGRYDRLFGRLGVDVTAAGFSISLDRIQGRDAESVDGGSLT